MRRLHDRSEWFSLSSVSKEKVHIIPANGSNGHPRIFVNVKGGGYCADGLHRFRFRCCLGESLLQQPSMPHVCSGNVRFANPT